VSKTSGDKEVDTKLEDILKSIRGIIDNHNQAIKSEFNEPDFIIEEPILELTRIISNEKEDFKDENENLVKRKIFGFDGEYINASSCKRVVR
jgi:hypothetical protein